MHQRRRKKERESENFGEEKRRLGVGAVRGAGGVRAIGLGQTHEFVLQRNAREISESVQVVF